MTTASHPIYPPPAARYAPHPTDVGPSTAVADRAAAADALLVLDTTTTLLAAHRVDEAVACLVPGLRRAYDAMSAEAWRAFGGAPCLTHPLAAMMHQDPFVRRAFDKPRGYPGDAGLLDLIYRAVPLPADTTALGATLYARHVHSSACHSVRFRRDFLAREIDRAAAEAPGGARVLSLACGHVREAQRSHAVRAGALAAFHAVDQDPRSLALVRAEHAALGVAATEGSVRDVLGGRLAFGGLTLAYAAGLYDYLPAPVATRLTRRLFDMLAPGGRLLVANFRPSLVDVGVMETFMDWRLIYRDDDEVAAFAAEIPAEQVAARRVFRDPFDNVAYLEVQRM